MALNGGVAAMLALATLGCSDATDSSLYYLYPPLFSTETYLVSDDGEVVHSWSSDYDVAQSAYLQDDGSVVDSSGLWLDSVVELRVDGTDDYRVVWEWRTSDHLVQDVDPTKENYGSVADNPQLIDVNHESDFSGIATEDLMHINSVFYVEELDQVIVASYNYSELWIIDHSTSTEEAAGHRGGRYGRGGDLLYRWGNPSAYDHGNAPVFNVSGLHDANWIAETRRIALFDNAVADTARSIGASNSRVVVIEPPLEPDGSYAIGSDGVFGPAAPVLAADLGFEEDLLGTARRLPDGRYSSCDCLESEVVLLAPDGTVQGTVAMPASGDEGSASGAVGTSSAYRILPYPSDARGIAALR